MMDLKTQKPTKPKYVKLSLKPNEARFLLSFLDNQNLTRKEWQESDIIRSKLYTGFQEILTTPSLTAFFKMSEDPTIPE